MPDRSQIVYVEMCPTHGPLDASDQEDDFSGVCIRIVDGRRRCQLATEVWTAKLLMRQPAPKEASDGE